MVALLLFKVTIFGEEMMFVLPSTSLAWILASTMVKGVPVRVAKLKPIELLVLKVVGTLLAWKVVGPNRTSPPILKDPRVMVPQSKPISRAKVLLASTTRASIITCGVGWSMVATRSLACLTFAAVS